jgi:hypothetical protein
LRALLAFVLAQLAVAVLMAPMAGAFDPGRVAATANDPALELNVSSEFRLKLADLVACAWPGCNVAQSNDVVIQVHGSDRLTGTFAERYQITVTGVQSFAQNYTTIAVVLKGNTTGVVLQGDANSERTGDLAFTKNVNGASVMNITLLPSNTTGNITMYVFGYVGNGNRSTIFVNHSGENTSAQDGPELYQLAVKPIQMRAQRVLPVNVTVTNNANVSLTNVLVSFFAKGPHDSGYRLIGNSTVAALNARGNADVGVAWDATWEEPSLYTVKVMIDPLHQHEEVSEDNNVVFAQVNLGPAPEASTQSTIGQVFLWGTLASVIAVAVALYWYNRVYE